jgi:hypothetical protein
MGEQEQEEFIEMPQETFKERLRCSLGLTQITQVKERHWKLDFTFPLLINIRG